MNTYVMYTAPSRESSPFATVSLSRIKRKYLLATGSALLTVLTVGDAANGDSWICVDEFIHHPAIAILFILIPAVGAILSILLAVLPRVVQVNLLIFVCLWLLIEGIFQVINTQQAPLENENREALNGGKYFMSDAALGYRPVPNSIERHTESHDHHMEFDVTYHFDSFGRRSTPPGPQAQPVDFLLFFGDSNTLGTGLKEDETLPYYAGQLAPGYQPYNYGFSGWGPGQMLELLKSGEIPAQLRQREGFAIFFFIKDHLARVAGSSLVAASWGSDFPYYALDRENHLVRKGDFAHGRRFLTLFYYLVSRSPIAQHFGLTLPGRYSDYDYRLTAEILAESQRLLRHQLKLRGFYVVISPAFDKTQLDTYRTFEAYLQRAGVKYTDYTELYDTAEVKYRLSNWNYHNSALANRLIAEQLLKDLGITGAGNP